MISDIQLRVIGPLERDLLIAMYDRFEPLSAALGLPPHTSEARQRWVGSTLRQIVNVAAFSPVECAVGHSFLAADHPESAEAAVFVHQEFRGRGIGAALLRKALELGRATGVQRVWAVTSPESRAALRLLKSCDFREIRSDFDVAELEIDFGVPPESRDLVRSVVAGYLPKGPTTSKEEF